MTNRSILYVTGNRLKETLVTNFFTHHTPKLSLQICKVDLLEPQSLDEATVVKHKAFHAHEIFNRTVLVDDEGFYIKKYPCFPGTLSKFIVHGMGWPGLLEIISPDDIIEYYCNVGFVNDDGTFHRFRGCIHGRVKEQKDGCDMKNKLLVDMFIPDGQTKELSQLKKHPKADELFPRNQALTLFLNSFYPQSRQ